MGLSIGTGKSSCTFCGHGIGKGERCFHWVVNSRAAPFFHGRCLFEASQIVAGTHRYKFIGIDLCDVDANDYQRRTITGQIFDITDEYSRDFNSNWAFNGEFKPFDTIDVDNIVDGLCQIFHTEPESVICTSKPSEGFLNDNPDQNQRVYRVFCPV